MIIYEKGDLLQSDVQIKVHQTNCLGAMGAGIALQIRNKYPKVYEEYRDLCKNNSPDKLMGSIQVVEIGNGDAICNLFGQYDHKSGEIQTNYEAFVEGLKELVEYIKQHNIKSVGFPMYIVCGLAGGDWNMIHTFLKAYFGPLDITCKIVEFEG